MTSFEYRPKFVDIRVKKSGKTGATAKAERDPPARGCDHIGCKLPGAHRAPKGRDHSNQFWHFCLEHATEYNRRWDYFAGMNDAELAAYRAREEVGHRPTWTFRSGRLDRFSAAARAHQTGQAADPFAMFSDGEPAPAKARKEKRRLSKVQLMALEVLSLDENADGPQIRARYAEQVKRWHPDSNGGDRAAETQLRRVVQAYHTLKAGGLV